MWIENSDFGKNADYLIPIYSRVASASRAPVLERARDFFIGGTISRVILLIDGFNVYHSLKENPEHHKYLWLDYRTLAERFTRKEDTIPKVIYFSAFATWIPYSMKRHRLLIDALKHPFSPFLPIMPFGQAVSTRHMPLATFYFPLTLCASRLAAFHSKRASAGQIARLARYLILLNSCKKYPPNVFSALSLLSQKAFRKRQQKFTVAGLCLRKFLQRLGLLNAETGGS